MKAYAKFVNESDYPKDDYEAAIQWCKRYVDGIDILPKLPSHLRIHRDRWDRNQRVRECVERSSATNARLDELNAKIATSNNPNRCKQLHMRIGSSSISPVTIHTK